MTPEEKAKELVEKFRPFVETWDYTNDEPMEEKYVLRDMKACALIAVGEVIESQPTEHTESYHQCISDTIDEAIGFWQQVKIEIEKL